MTQEEEITLDINLKILGNSESVQIPLPNTITVDSIKILAADYTDIPIDKMRLILTGRAMRNGTTLKDYDVHNGSTIHIVPERPRNQRSQQNPPPPQQNTQTQQQQSQSQPIPPPTTQTQVQPQPQTFPTPSHDLIDFRTTVSNAQQILSEVSFAAATLQRAVNQSAVGSSNEALQTFCQRFFESYSTLLDLNNHISYTSVRNQEGNPNELEFTQREPDAMTEFQDNFMFGFTGALNPFMGAPNTVILDPQENSVSNSSNTPTTTSLNQSSNTNTSSANPPSSTSTTTETSYSASFSLDPSSSQIVNITNSQMQSISSSFQGEIAPGVQAMVDVQVVNDQDGAETENNEAIIEVNDINIDLDNFTPPINQNPTTTTTTTETTNSGNTTITTTTTTTLQQPIVVTEPNTDNQNNQQNEPPPPPIPIPIEEVEDLSQIVLDPEEIAIVNADAAALRNNFEPPAMNLDYFRQHNTGL